MNLQDFEEHIDNRILERGLDYYKDGCVAEITEIKKNEWSAVVKGTENYHVKVAVENGRIISVGMRLPLRHGPNMQA